MCVPSSSFAYSVLAHEALIDNAWSKQIVPLLTRRFPGSSIRQLEEARAYAYGGSLIEDLGYYPFGSHFFSNLVHYVRSGDFVAALVRDAQTVDEYTFALGALAQRERQRRPSHRQSRGAGDLPEASREVRR